jgi:hypothetical protein
MAGDFPCHFFVLYSLTRPVPCLSIFEPYARFPVSDWRHIQRTRMLRSPVAFTAQAAGDHVLVPGLEVSGIVNGMSAKFTLD